MDKSYKIKLEDQPDSSSFRFFSEHPISKWSFPDFMHWYNKDKTDPAQEKKVKNTYLSVLHSIERTKNVPDYVKKECRRLSLTTSTPQNTPEHINMNITAHGSSVVNALGFGTFNTHQQQPPSAVGQPLAVEQPSAPLQQPQKEELEESDDEESTDEEKIPSDLSAHHHPQRTCEYTLAFINAEKKEEWGAEATALDKALDSNWLLDGLSISDLCYGFKTATVKLAKRADPAQLSDIRILAMNDVFLFDRNAAPSVTKYFPSEVRTALKPMFSFDANLPTQGVNCYA